MRQYVELWLKSGAGTSCGDQAQEIASNGKSKGAKGHKQHTQISPDRSKHHKTEDIVRGVWHKSGAGTRVYKL